MQDPQDYQLSRYRLLKLIGQGAFSYVYLAEQMFLKTRVAVKIMRLPDLDQANFLKEAEIIGQLVHPHIVLAYDCGVEGELYYLAMAYAANGSMRQRYPKRSRLAPFEVVHYVGQAADALHYAHSQNIIHRDIKPENMLLGPENELWLSDFGLSLELPSSRSLSLHEIAGTLNYMAPEQAHGKPRFASDQYSLAAVAYEWLCGRCPFEGSYSEVITQLLLSPVPSLRAISAPISPAVEEVILKALAKEPQERFATVQAFARALEDASNATPTVLSFQPQASEAATRTSDLQGAETIPPIQVPPTVSVYKAQTLPPTSSTHARSRRPSRRTVIGALLGFAAVLSAGIAALELSKKGTIQARPPSPSTTIQAQHLSPGTTVFTYTKHIDEVKSVAWSPDGRRIASAGADKDETVRLWDATNGDHELVYLGHKREKLAPPLKTNPVKAALWSPDGTYIASGDEVGKVRVWRTNDESDLPATPYTGHNKPVRTLAWSHDGSFIASGSEDTQVQLWNAQTSQRRLTFTLHKSPVFGVAWSHDDSYIASGSGNKNPLKAGDNTVYIWDAASGKVITTYEGHSRTVRSVAWSPEVESNLIASASEDGTIQVWNAFTGKLSISYKVPISNNISNGVEAISWSPDGSMIAAACGGLPMVVVWRIVDGKPLLFYTKHKKGLWSVAWSPNGRMIVSGSMDYSAHVWVAPQ